jgi:hypothetical protein
VTDINNPSVPENILIPDTGDTTNINMGNFTNTISAISPYITEESQSTLITQETTTNSNQAELNTANNEMTYTNDQVK